MNKDFVKKIVLVLILAAGLAMIGWGVKAGFSKIADSKRVVSVRGLAEREVMADKVTWPIVYNLAGNDLPTLYDETEKTNAIITEFLTSNGLSKDEISVCPPDVFDQQSNRYNNENYTYRFNITQVVLVTSSNVEGVNALIMRQGELLKKGIALNTQDYSNQTSYEFTKLNDIKPEMIAEATRNAREAAQKFADDSESEIGRIMSAYQGQFSITDRDSYTPYIKNVRVVTSIDFSLED